MNNNLPLIKLFIVVLVLSWGDLLWADDRPLPLVGVNRLEELVFHPLKKVPAQVVSLQRSLLSAEISALVEQVHVQVGEHVTAKQLLVSLDCTDYELNKERLLAEKKALDADYNFALYQYTRSKKLVKSHSVSEEIHQQQASTQAKLAAQQQLLHARIRQSEKKISRCYIKAPYAGVITKRLVHMGENVAPGTSLMQIIDIHDVEVEVQVPVVLVDELDYTALNFIYRQHSYPLKLRAVIPSVETRARHQRVRLSFVAEKTLPDAYGMVEIVLRKKQLPANYLVSRDKHLGLFILKKNTQQQWLAQFYMLKNALPGRAADIDLPMDTQVIIAGRHALHDDQKVQLQRTNDND